MEVWDSKSAYLVTMSADAHKKIVRFNISMYERFTMYVFYPTDHLIGQHQDCFDGEPPGAEVEEILQRGSQQVHHQHVVISLLAVPSETKQKYRISKVFVNFALRGLRR